MHRRDLFRQLGALVLVGTGATTTRRYGRLDVEGHRAHRHATGETLHVWLDGREVTHNCYLADDVAGYVEVFCADEQSHRDLAAHGAKHLASEGRCACRLRAHGRVVIAPGAPL